MVESEYSSAESKDNSTLNTRHDFRFLIIAKKAIATQQDIATQEGEKSPSSEDIEYWRELRKILFKKHTRQKEAVAST